jgi:hypothetical protein
MEQPRLLVTDADSRPELREPTDALAALRANTRTALVAGGHAGPGAWAIDAAHVPRPRRLGETRS